MTRNYPTLILFLLLGSYSFSQTTKQKIAAVTILEPKPASEVVLEVTATAASATVFEKTPLSIAQKGAPAIFYIENDKPIDRQTYLRHLQQALLKK